MDSQLNDSLHSFGWPVDSDWTPQLKSFFQSATWEEIRSLVETERRQHTVFPSPNNVFRAFELTPYASTRVVILGQDPYHGPDQAHGLCFSVMHGTKIPPSLRNILKELHSDIGMSKSDDRSSQPNGCLESWASQGVFLLNTVLTVRQASANSHRKFGWLKFTDHVIRKLNEHDEDLIFVLWGKPAEKKRTLIDQRHHVLIAPHPSPLSAHRGYFGSRPFSKINEILTSQSSPAIDWEL